MSDPEVESLARALRWTEAAELAVERGDRERGFELAIAGGVRPMIVRLAEGAAPEERAHLAAVAVRQRSPWAEGALLQAGSAFEEAARCFERAADLRAAGESYVRAGQPLRAGRCLEQHLRSAPDDDEARATLVALLLDAGRSEPALGLIGERDGAPWDRLRRRATAALGLGDGQETSIDSTRPPRPVEGLLFGRFEVVAEIASSATARVVEAIDRLSPNRDRCAVKVFHASALTGAGRDALARFHREVAILAALDGPALVKPIAVFDEGPTLVLPYLPGGSLEARLARGPLAPTDAGDVADRVLSALEVAHRRGVVHRDIKPANVLFDALGAAHLVDFGVAHLDESDATATAGVLGTLHWMSPEQRRGEPATSASDLYAVGLLLAASLGIDPEAPPPELPAAATRLIAQLLADAPAERPEDATVVRAALAKIAWPAALPIARAVAAPSGSASFERHLPCASSPLLFDDGWLERRERRLALDDSTTELLRRWLDARHPALARLLSVDLERNEARLEHYSSALAVPLDAALRDSLREAVAALHRAGLAHGALATSIGRGARGLIVVPPARAAAWPDAKEADLRALEALGAAP